MEHSQGGFIFRSETLQSQAHSDDIEAFCESELEAGSASEVVRAIADAYRRSKIKANRVEPIALPSSRLDNIRGRIVGLESLFKNPLEDCSEPSSLAFDDAGVQRKLNSVQKESVRNKGQFEVPSVEFPGLSHVWKVHGFLQKGAENIKQSFQDDVNAGLSHIAAILIDFVGRKCEIGAAWRPQANFSVKKGVKNAFDGLWGIVSCVIGLIETKPANTPDRIKILLDEEFDRYVLKKFRENRVQDHPDRIPFDKRLYDKSLEKELAPLIQRIRKQSSDSWREQRGEVKKALRKDLRALHPSIQYAALEKLVNSRMIEIESEHLRDRLGKDEELQASSPGYGVLYAKRIWADELSAVSEEKFNRKADANELKEDIKKEVSRKHKIMSKNRAWLEDKVGEQVERCRARIRSENSQELLLKLTESGLMQDATIMRTRLEFDAGEGARLKKHLESERRPEHTRAISMPIWSTQRWVLERQELGNGRVLYYKRTHTMVAVSSGVWFWRLIIAFHVAQAVMSRCLLWAFIHNMWNSQLGVRALVLPARFYPERKLDHATGAVEVDYDCPVPTFAHNLWTVWAKVAAARAAFEAAPEHGFLRKRHTRWLHVLFSYVIRGAGGTMLLVVAQPILTAINVVVTLSIVIICPVFVLALLIAAIACNVLIVDIESIHRNKCDVCPVPLRIVVDVLVLGLGQAAACALRGIVVRPALCLGWLAFAVVRGALQTIWDAAIWAALLRYGTVPAVNGWAATRVSGPGVAWEHLYQVEPAVVALAVRAQLEAAELHAIEAIERSRIVQPREAYLAFFKAIAQPFGKIDVSCNSTTARLAKNERTQLLDLERSISGRRVWLAALSSLPLDVRPKLSSADLARALADAEEAAASFYAERLMPALRAAAAAGNKKAAADGEEAFWGGQQADEGDFGEVGRRLVAAAFGEDVLEPLEVTDRAFVSRVSEESLSDVLACLPPMPSIS